MYSSDGNVGAGDLFDQHDDRWGFPACRPGHAQELLLPRIFHGSGGDAAGFGQSRDACEHAQVVRQRGADPQADQRDRVAHGSREGDHGEAALASEKRKTHTRRVFFYLFKLFTFPLLEAPNALKRFLSSSTSLLICSFTVSGLSMFLK